MARSDDRARRALSGELDEQDQRLLEFARKAELYDQQPNISGLTGRPWPLWIRVWIYELLVKGVPPSSIPGVMMTSVSALNPGAENVKLPCESFMRRARQEVRIIAETMAAYTIGRASDWKQLGADGTDRNQIALITSNLRVVLQDGTLSDVVLRAAYLTGGKTAEMEMEAIDTKCFARLRDYLRWWIQMHEKMFGETARRPRGDHFIGMGWYDVPPPPPRHVSSVRRRLENSPQAPHSIPDPDQTVGLHRMAGGMVSSDGANQARKLVRMLIELIGTAVEEHVGKDAWDKMSKEEQGKAMRTRGAAGRSTPLRDGLFACSRGRTTVDLPAKKPAEATPVAAQVRRAVLASRTECLDLGRRDGHQVAAQDAVGGRTLEVPQGEARRGGPGRHRQSDPEGIQRRPRLLRQGQGRVVHSVARGAWVVKDVVLPDAAAARRRCRPRVARPFAIRGTFLDRRGDDVDSP